MSQGLWGAPWATRLCPVSADASVVYIAYMNIDLYSYVYRYMLLDKMLCEMSFIFKYDKKTTSQGYIMITPITRIHEVLFTSRRPATHYWDRAHGGM